MPRRVNDDFDLIGGAAGAASKVEQALEPDPVKRKMIEDHAQHILEQHYRDDDWVVEDTRIGNPYDAVATRGDQTIYLEAKGTQTRGGGVRVTIGEVNHARSHPGRCIMGIVSGIKFIGDHEIDKSSGTLRLLDWDPDAGTLSPVEFVWKPE